MNNLMLAYILIALGLLLLAAELFLYSGFLFIMSLSAIIGGVALTFFYGDTSTGVLTLIVVFIILPVLSSAILHYGPKTRLGRRKFQTGPEDDATVETL